MTRPRIAVLGSANMDLVVTVDRAPSLGETVTGRTFHTVPGGKGANQALAAVRAGGDVTFLGAVGDDVYGAEIRALLAGERIVTALATSDQPTGTAHIVVDARGGNSIVVVPGANGTVTTLTGAHRTAITAADVLLLQLELPIPVVVEAAAFARSAGIRVVLTPAPAAPLTPDLLAVVDLLVPNEHEAALLIGESSGRGSPHTAGTALATRTNAVLLTLGSAGSAYFAGDAAPIEVPAFAVDVVDTTAAGDTFVGAFAVAHAEGRPVAEAMRWASAAAALSVQRLGASSSMPERAEVDAFLERA
ncbi:MAG TPA: ribokinase [Jiangellaceae bacterium]|nr:ribokinase [Jiangellaceae bacterium]